MVESGRIMNDSRPNLIVGAIVISASTGVVVFFLAVFVLVGLGVWANLIPWSLFGPQPKQFAWAMLIVYGIAVFVAGLTAWLTFRVLVVRTKPAR
jgi:hypothetical protein